MTFKVFDAEHPLVRCVLPFGEDLGRAPSSTHASHGQAADASSLAPRRFLVALGVFGVGIVGIAVFPGNVATYHPLFSLRCFVGGSVTAILSRKILDVPLRSSLWCWVRRADRDGIRP
jgi:hypothetical protein